MNGKPEINCDIMSTTFLILVIIPLMIEFCAFAITFFIYDEYSMHEIMNIVMIKLLDDVPC